MDPRVSSIGELPAIGEAAICMGVFDGVHRGHLALLAATVKLARDLRVRPVALVFDPHPEEVIRHGSQVARLAPVRENVRRMREAGIEAVPLRFDDALRTLAAEEFLAAMAPAINVRGLVMTPESAFGRNRGGTPQAVRELGRRSGFELQVIERVPEGEEPISSGRIRRTLADGALDEAATLLGHPPYLEGTAGRRGVMAFRYRPALPAAGTYHATLRGAVAGSLELRIDPEDTVLLAGDHPGGTLSLDLNGRT